MDFSSPTVLLRRCCVLLVVAASLVTLAQAKEAKPSPTLGARIDVRRRVIYPRCSAVVDVTAAPYHAKGDGKTDDTAAIQQAVSDVMGLHKILYFPAGTYLISRTILWSKKNSGGREAWGKNTLQGENAATTTIRLKDETFTDPKKPESMMWCGGFGSADWFHNYVRDLTFDVGRGNPGAIGLQFYSNNSGAVRNCRFVAGEGGGAVGLDLGHRDMNGPLLVKNCEVTGFRRGISTARAVNGQTFERITLRGHSEAGFSNAGQAVSVRGLVSEGTGVAVSTYGVFCLVDARLSGSGEAARVPAVVNYNGGKIFLRDVHTSGYSRAIGDVVTPDFVKALQIRGEDKPGSLGPDVAEYGSHAATSPFPSARSSLRLPVKETPEVPLDPPGSWANVDDFGADPTGERDSSAAFQAAVDSEATTVFLPGQYALKKTVILRGKVRRLLGTGGIVDYTRQVQPDFRIVDGESPVVMIEHLAYVHGGIEIDTRRTVAFRSVSDCDLTSTEHARGGELYFDDFVTHALHLNGQKAWARQLNVENQGTHIVNEAGDLWVLGYKTERGGTLLETRGGARSEVLGGFSYTTTAGKLAPMFVNDRSSVFAYFGEVCFSGDPFSTLIRETRGTSTKDVERGQGGTTPYIGYPGTP